MSDRFEKFLKEIDDEDKELILTGDFNCDLLKIYSNNPNIKKLEDLIDVSELQQDIDNPTRISCWTKTRSIMREKIGDF